jgi:hypothetical protein
MIFPYASPLRTVYREVLIVFPADEFLNGCQLKTSGRQSDLPELANGGHPVCRLADSAVSNPNNLHRPQMPVKNYLLDGCGETMMTTITQDQFKSNFLYRGCTNCKSNSSFIIVGAFCCVTATSLE